MSLNVRLHNTCAADLKSCLQHIKFLKKYIKIYCITVKIFHIVMFYSFIHKKGRKTAKIQLFGIKFHNFFYRL